MSSPCAWLPNVVATIQHKWAAIESIATTTSCTSQTLLTWVRQYEQDTGQRERPTTADQKHVKAPEREVRELCTANEILKLASVFFAQAELNR